MKIQSSILFGANKGVVGRDGEGPGEFRRPNYAGWNGDTLWVSDQGLMRITLVSAEPVLFFTPPTDIPHPPSPRGRDPLSPHVHTFSFGLLFIQTVRFSVITPEPMVSMAVRFFTWPGTGSSRV